ncbi:putative ribonuclease H-like domain-containing protein [Tanacetum coccineum]
MRPFGCPVTKWSTACYVQNRVLITKPHNKTPYELLIGRSPNLDFMRPFGCHVTILNTLDHLGKFEGKAYEGLLVGYSVNNKAFKVFNTRTKKVEENLHIKFLENKPNLAGSGPEWLFDIDSLIKSMNNEPVIIGNQTNDDVGIETNVNVVQTGQKKAYNHEYILLPFLTFDSQGPKSSDDELALTRSHRLSELTAHSVVRDIRKNMDKAKQNRLTDAQQMDKVIVKSQAKVVTPSSSKNASNDEPQPSNDAGKKDDGVRKENEIDNQERPENSTQDVNTAGLSINTASININTGSLNINTVSSNDQSMPSSEETAIFADVYDDREVGAEADTNNLELSIVMDVKSAFLYGTIDKEVYVSQPPGFEDPQFPDKVYKVYVDDIIFGSTKKSLCVEFEQMMHKRFQMSSMGELTFLLGLQVKQKDNGIFISQDKYVADVLKKFDFSSVKTASTPMEPNKALIKDCKAG